jgi:DNA-binding MarR family transcriptional regulator
MTAGQLARETGLTTGAITGVVDRLAARGYVRREEDPEDRRRVLLQADEKRAHKEIGPVFARMQKRMAQVAAEYSEAELAMLVEFCRKCEAAARDEAESLP